MAKHGIARPKKIYGRLSGMLGIYLYWKLCPAVMSQTDAYESWMWYAAKCQDKLWIKEYFAPLSSGAQRNVDESALRQRTEYMLANPFINEVDGCAPGCDEHSEASSDDDDDA